MNRIPLIPVFRAFVLLAFAPVVLRADPPPPQPLTAAILDFQTDDSLKGKGAEAAILLNAELSGIAPDLVLVERQELEKVLGEQELGASGVVTPDTAAKLGSLTGAKVLVTGRLFNAGDRFFLVAKIISSDTGRVYGETATFEDPSALDRAVGDLAPKIAMDIKNHADTLVAKAEDPDERVDRLKKLVAGHTPLPSVSVVIPEQHIGAYVIDPAAQTEMKLILQQIGFDVIDPHSGRQADVQITGDAFSELAGRYNNLVSCRARVEIRMIRPLTGKLLLADRETAVAVDVAEHVVGKTALEIAAAKMLDRIVPKLAGL